MELNILEFEHFSTRFPGKTAIIFQFAFLLID
jgi:hypothetical protein